MKIAEVEDILYKEARQADPVSILILGGPGIGKTHMQKEVANRVAKTLSLEFKEYDDSIEFDG